MTKGVLLIGYGTRKGNLEEILGRQLARLEARGRDRVYLAYFRVSEPSIEDALRRMAADGIDEVLAVPYYIAEGRLTYELIPGKMGVPIGGNGETVVDGRKVRVSMSPAFGMTRVLFNILCDRIAESGCGKDDGILVIGHGSRDVSSSNRAIIAMNADRLRKIGYSHVAYAFNEFDEPAIGDAVSGLVSEGVEKIAVLPLFIAMGVHLCEEVAEKIGIPPYSDGGDIDAGGRKVSVRYMRPVEDDPRLLELIDSEIADFYGD